ncbi:MAG: T9SS type B sorting domain-containing protein, partial [Sphingobacteriales bacterium]
SFTGLLSRAVGENIGDHAIGQGTLALSTNYALDYTGANLSIGKKTITVTAAAKNKIYGDADPALTYTFAPGLITGDTFTGNLTRTIGENIGDYAIGQGTLALSANYTLTFVAANLSIAKKTINVTAVAKTKVYGETDPRFTYTVSPALVSGDAFFGELKRASGESAGTYAINIGNLGLTPNYQLLFAPANLIIGKKDIAVSIEAKSKIYGSPDPAFTYTFSPALSLGDSFTGSPTRTAGEIVGQYIINPGTLVLTANYNVSYSNGLFNITPKTISVTADAKSKTYGDTDPQFTYNLGAGLLAGDVLTGSLTRSAGENIGSYPITQGTLSGNGNYAISFTGNVISINKKALLIRADDKVKSQGAANPLLTASYSGFANGDNSNVLALQPVLSTTATATSLTGTYPIIVSGATAQNYAITYQHGALTVQAGSISDIVLASTALYENSAAGTNVGQVTSLGENPNSIYTYTLVSGTGSADNASFRISGNVVQTAVPLNFEAKSSYGLRVRSTDQNGLSFEKAFTIALLDVNEAPTLDVIANQTVCATTTDQIINLSGITAGPETAQTTILTVTSTNPTLFSSLVVTKGIGTVGTLAYKLATGAVGTAVITVMVKDNGGTSFGGEESTSRAFSLSVNAPPVISITSDKGLALFKGETALLTASGGTTYAWANANGIVSGQNSAVLSVKPDATTTYTVTATNANGCTEVKSLTLTLSDLPVEQGITAKATNVMSPNGDGVNDTWVVENIQLYPKNSVRIVDRAGRLVYEKKGYDNTWDATIKGVPLAEGTYYYIIDFGDGKTIKKGFITILRKK